MKEQGSEKGSAHGKQKTVFKSGFGLGVRVRIGVRVTEGAHLHISLSIIHRYTETNNVWCSQRCEITLIKTQLSLLLTLTSARASRSGRRSNLSVFSRSFDFDSVSFSQLLGDNKVVNSFELCGAKSWNASCVRVCTCVRDWHCLSGVPACMSRSLSFLHLTSRGRQRSERTDGKLRQRGE